jgi:hypothetical protein
MIMVIKPLKVFINIIIEKYLAIWFIITFTGLVVVLFRMFKELA